MAAVLLSAVASARQDAAASEADDTAAQESDEVTPLTSQEPGTLKPPKWGGPNAVENQLAKDAEPKQTVFRFEGIQRGLKPYFDFKQRLKADTGFSFGMDYSAVYFSASESLGEDRADLLGIGLNWGEPNEDTFGSGRSDQYTAELFYRVQLSPNFAITPDLQFIVDPALNPAETSITVLGLRVRLSL